jgi:hypothetical protein
MRHPADMGAPKIFAFLSYRAVDVPRGTAANSPEPETVTEPGKRKKVKNAWT